MSQNKLLQKQQKAIRSFLAACAIFTGGITTANAQEESTRHQSCARQTDASGTWQQTFAKIDTICLTAVRNNLILREGDKPYLYLDSKGILHTGVGLNVNDYASFQELDFVKENGDLLTEREKRAYFARIKTFQRQQAKLGFNYKSSYYARHFTIRPTKGSRDRMFIKRMNNSMQSVKEMLGIQAYYNLHAIAQSEIIMMHYNMGSNRFNPEKWPKFFGAARRADYITMSQECHTKSVSEERNQMVADSFRNIAQARWYAYGTMYQKQNSIFHPTEQTKTM